LPQNKYYIFGEGGGQQLATKWQVPLLGQIPLVQSIRESGDAGLPEVLKQDSPSGKIFEEVAQAVAQQVSVRNAGLAKTKIVPIIT
jgi:ATP-binding protein involved in chromosome partitioning